jgi:uncharacterized membrane protein YhaH (DUF805 family)
MGFINAIKSGFKNYFKFSGVATRPEYWYWVLLNLILAAVVFLVHEYVSLEIFQILLMTIPTLSVTVRRLRDAGYSWVWMLLKVPGIIPLIIGYVAYFSGWFRLTLGGGLNLVAGQVDQANLQFALAIDELRGAVITIYLSFLYIAGSFLLVWGFFTTRKSKSFEEGNKRVAPKNPENPVI